MNINHELVATRLLTSNINQIEFWLTFDIKHQTDTVWFRFDKNVFFFIQAKFQSKSVKLYTFLESTYPEMQRKLIPRVYEYQSSTSSHLVDRVLVDF